MSSVEQVRENTHWAAEAGFDSFWVSKIFSVSPVVALAPVGGYVPAFTELGTSVVPLAGGHPLALSAHALSAQSGLDGRSVLDIGPSHQVVLEGQIAYFDAGATDLRISFEPSEARTRDTTRDAFAELLGA